MKSFKETNEGWIEEVANDKILEVEIYKERLADIEAAFRYNLDLLCDRDLELDALEDQLRHGVKELEKISQQKSDWEELASRMEKQRSKEIASLKDRLMSREKLIRQLQRKTWVNVSELKKAVDDLKREQSIQTDKLSAKFESEKNNIKKNFVALIHAKELKRLEEINELNEKYVKQLDEIAKEKQRFILFQTENRNLKKELLKLKKENDKKEKAYLTQIKHLDKIYSEVAEQMEMIRSKQVSQIETKATWAKPILKSTSTQTSFDDQNQGEFLFVQRQNEVLKSVIKDLKRNRESQNACDNCARIKNESDESNRRFEIEINELKKAIEDERSQRFEEDSVIQNLEESVFCLKEKLLNQKLTDTTKRQLLSNALDERPTGNVKFRSTEKETLGRSLTTYNHSVVCAETDKTRTSNKPKNNIPGFVCKGKMNSLFLDCQSQIRINNSNNNNNSNNERSVEIQSETDIAAIKISKLPLKPRRGSRL